MIGKMKYRFKLIVPLTYYDEAIDSDEVELSEQDVMLIRSLVKESRNRRRGQIDWDCVDYVCQIPKFAKS